MTASSGIPTGTFKSPTKGPVSRSKFRSSRPPWLPGRAWEYHDSLPVDYTHHQSTPTRTLNASLLVSSEYNIQSYQTLFVIDGGCSKQPSKDFSGSECTPSGIRALSQKPWKLEGNGACRYTAELKRSMTLVLFEHTTPRLQTLTELGIKAGAATGAYRVDALY